MALTVTVLFSVQVQAHKAKGSRYPALRVKKAGRSGQQSWAVKIRPMSQKEASLLVDRHGRGTRGQPGRGYHWDPENLRIVKCLTGAVIQARSKGFYERLGFKHDASGMMRLTKEKIPATLEQIGRKFSSPALEQHLTRRRTRTPRSQRGR